VLHSFLLPARSSSLPRTKAAHFQGHGTFEYSVTFPLVSGSWTGRGSFYIERAKHSLCEQCKCLGVIFHRKVTCRIHVGTLAAKTFRIFFIICLPLFKSERFRPNSELTLCTALIMSIMTYACPAWGFTTDSHLLKLQLL
jgi:hypothetical protein